VRAPGILRFGRKTPRGRQRIPCGPNLSKDYLAGSAPEEWVPLKTNNFYAKHGIELQLNSDVKEIDIPARQVVLGDGSNGRRGV